MERWDTGRPDEERTARCPAGTYVAGVEAGAWLLELPELPELPEPPEPPDEPLPPMFGQLTLAPPEPWFGRLAGGVVGFDGSVVLGAEEAAGAGLAADTTATAPPITSSAASVEVRTVRRRPECLVCGVGAGCSGAGPSDGVSGGEPASAGPAVLWGHAIPMVISLFLGSLR